MHWTTVSHGYGHAITRTTWSNCNMITMSAIPRSKRDALRHMMTPTVQLIHESLAVFIVFLNQSKQNKNIVCVTQAIPTRIVGRSNNNKKRIKEGISSTMVNDDDNGNNESFIFILFIGFLISRPMSSLACHDVGGCFCSSFRRTPLP